MGQCVCRRWRIGARILLADNLLREIRPRILADSQENRYETALRTERDVQAEVTRELDRLQQPLNAEQEQLLERYAEDLQSLWRAPTTGAADRKRIVRCLIEAVVVSTPRDSSTLTAKVHWKGGKVTIIELAKGRTGLHRYVSPPELVELIRKLAGEFTDAQIARILRRKKLLTPKGHSFMAYHVANVRLKHAIAPGPRVPLLGQDVYTAEHTDGWPSLKAAAAALGISTDTVLQIT